MLRNLLAILLISFVAKSEAQSVGGVVSGGNLYCDTVNSGFLSLTSFNGDKITWQSSTDSIVWANTGVTDISVQSYYHVKQTTWYRAIVQDGVLTPDTSNVARLTIYPKSIGGTLTGGGTFCGTSGIGMLYLSGYTGSILNWLSSTNNGTNWTPISNTEDSLNYSNITQNTLYKAVVQTNAACPTDTSTQVSFSFSPSIGGTLSAGGTFCKTSGSGTLTLTGYTGSVTHWLYTTDDGLNWTTIANTTNQQSYSNIIQNTTYLAVVQLNACPSDSSSASSFIFTPTVAGFLSVADSVVCYGVNSDSIYISGNTGEVTGWLSSVNNGLNWTAIPDTNDYYKYSNLTETTLYKAIVKNGSCDSDTTAAITIKVNTLPVVNAGNDTTIFKGDIIKLNANAQGTLVWTPASKIDSADVLTPTATIEETTQFVLTVTDTNLCVNADSVLITVKMKEFNGMVSNLFTPNSDGINDTWYIQDILSYPENEVWVYNIYGQLVFNKKGYANDWLGTYNGAALPDGTYYYVIKISADADEIKGAIDIFKNK